MKPSGNYINRFFLIAWLLILLLSCNNKKVPGEVKTSGAGSAKTKKVSVKPPGNYQDTLKISVPATVFYYPDSLQLERIKQLTDSSVYPSIMHEYFYQVRYAHNVIKQSFPKLKIIEAKNCRYLLFIKKDGSSECKDLDKYSDTYGLFAFDGKKAPISVDMMNLDTQISFYLKE